MMENRLKLTVKMFSDIVEAVEELEIVERETVSKLKVKLRLFDGSMLWAREVWIKGAIEAYSYYWLRSDETVIIGWDNAPHHQSVKTFPHHRHIGDRIEESQEREMSQVLKFIKNFLE